MDSNRLKKPTVTKISYKERAKNGKAVKAQNGKKVPLGSRPVGKPYEKNPGEAGKNFGKSDAGKMKPTMGGAKNGKKVYKSGGMGKCKGGC